MANGVWIGGTDRDSRPEEWRADNTVEDAVWQGALKKNQDAIIAFTPSFAAAKVVVFRDSRGTTLRTINLGALERSLKKQRARVAAELQRLDGIINALNSQGPRRSKLSAAGLRRIRLAQKKRRAREREEQRKKEKAGG